jgi:hypothetical protein
MSELTRRAFVSRSAGAAAGMTVIGSLVAEASDADAATDHADGSAVMAYVKDAKSGEVSLMKGQRTIKVRDRKLAAQIRRAAK